MGEFFIQIITCKERIAEVENIPPNGHFARWATLSDLLLTGQPILGGVREGEHVVKVQLAFEKDDDEIPISVASVYLLCECDIEVIASQRVQSALVTQQQVPQQKSKIATPTLIVPR